MAQIVLVTGGSRSGKSGFAQQLAESLAGPRLFIATCPATDAEMQDRIRRHRQARDPRLWDLCEELLDLDNRLAGNRGYETVLVDCLTLWVNNLMYLSKKSERQISETEVASQVDRLLATCRQRRGTVIFVTNEVGLGIVPANRAARLYRDLIGRCNQGMGRGADQVFLLSCGIPIQIKGEKQRNYEKTGGKFS